ncbi:hypothetical protein [Blastopirellula marina]|uniref:Uncharacterized protein n=1 Tax=Blastopirellula marina DSM 3645 TaxID=314230 RepID=A3ZXE0_9BACT|nr:hypothetical protein [Blastopirellula marina]EAQ78730.1 hypothetical protein DSM3645_29551 [Blastopirellula marina DSM 3645]
MSRLNLITGALLGLNAALVGVVFEPTITRHFNLELATKEVELPPVLNADGTIAKPKRSVINDLDRAENEARRVQYRKGSQNLMYISLSMIAMGLISANHRQSRLPAIGGAASFSLAAIIIGVCPIVAGICDMPIVAIFDPIGALAFAAGWICVVVAILRNGPPEASPK